VETAVRGQIEIQDSDKKKLESVLRDEREYLAKYLQSTEKVEAAHYSVNEGLQNRLQQRN
jgi:DNA-directed RNA polymerase subunit L